MLNIQQKMYLNLPPWNIFIYTDGSKSAEEVGLLTVIAEEEGQYLLPDISGKYGSLQDKI